MAKQHRQFDVLFVLALLGVMIGALGYFGPWVPHPSAALQVTGFELSEFAKFFPQVQGGVVIVHRYLFRAPWVSIVAALGLMVNRPWARRRLATHLGMTLLLSGLVLIALPPYEYLFDPSYRHQLMLVLGGALLTTMTMFATFLPRRVWGATLLLIALGGPLLALWQWARFWPLVPPLYDATFGWGWGVFACLAGMGLVALYGLWALVGRADT